MEFLAAGELDLIRAAVRRGSLDALSVVADARDLSLGEGARVVLVQAGRRLVRVEDAIVRVELLHCAWVTELPSDCVCVLGACY